VVGAFALAAHGYPRATGDIDIWVNPSPGNASKVYGALKKFGAPLNQLSQADLARGNVVFQIGVAPCRIDILTSITGVEFADASSDRVVIEFDGLSIPFISPRKLLQNKDAVGRPRDIEDAAKLRNMLKD
jgi:hypothetical protein